MIASNGLFGRFGISSIYHYAPLHYLPFIARAGALFSKTELRKQGFADTHFRSTSRRQDEQRGFAQYVHLTLDAYPPILKAKLNGGFPHFEIAVPSAQIEETEHALCRFNIAKARYFRGARQAPIESEANGRYYNGMALPVAISASEREALLTQNLGKNMIEVLAKDRLPIGVGTVFRFFSDEDQLIASDVLLKLGTDTYTAQRDSKLTYTATARFRDAVEEVLSLSISDPTWLGNGLEYDHV